MVNLFQKGAEPMTSDAKKAAKAKYDAKTAKYYSLKLNQNTDAAMINHLAKQESFQTYIKHLILQDMNKPMPKGRIPQPEQDLDKIEQHFDATLALMQSIAKK